MLSAVANLSSSQIENKKNISITCVFGVKFCQTQTKRIFNQHETATKSKELCLSVHIQLNHNVAIDWSRLAFSIDGVRL
jgi:hypothetical protein